MSEADIRTILATAVQTKTSVKCHVYIPSIMQPPCFIILPSNGSWDTNLNRTIPMLYYEIRYVSPANILLEETQRVLDAFLDKAEVKDAVETISATTWGGKASYARLIRWRDYGRPVFEDKIGIIFDVIVYGTQ